MRIFAIAGGALWTLSLLGGPVQAQARPAPGKAQAIRAAAYTTRTDGHYTMVQRGALPSHGPKRLQALKQAMHDEIHGAGAFARQGGDTPAFEIVSHAPVLKQVRDADTMSTPARYELAGSALKNGRLKATLLLPVSGHVGLAEAQRFAKGNQYNLRINGQAQPKVAAGGAFVKEHPVELQLKPGLNKIEFWADGSFGVGGYEGGRVVEIDVK